LNEKTNLKEDAIIGIIFTSFFAIGLFMISVSPSPIDIQTIVLGNILSITPSDTAQLIIISIITLSILILRWKDLMLLFYDEAHAQSIGIKPKRLKLIFFILLSVSTVAAMQTVGAFLVIAMVVTPGATAFLLVDRFSKLILISVSIGIFSCAFGTYSSYFLDGATGGMIILIQTILFILAFLLSPKYGYIKNISNRKKQRN
ncbi:MAG: metal ABC transporter permease, partial [Hyphomicrobiales bacterium]|nr:metal ABC transporter permease [Hyphomicrobiales bacterium]